MINMIKKVIKTISFLIFILLHLAFLIAIFLEKINNYYVIIFVLLACLLISITYINAPIDNTDDYIENYLSILFVVFGAVSTYYLNINLELGPVISAGIVGTLSSFTPKIQSDLLKLFPVAVYCGAFVGMSSLYVAKDINFILLSGFITGVIFIFSKSVFSGFGGKLGTIAFGGVTLTSLLIFIFS